MRQLKHRLASWLFQLENEILLPFLAVGIIVLGGFGAISFYNGYTIQKKGLESMARQMISVINEEITVLSEYATEEEICEKYRENPPDYVRITDARGQVVAEPGRPAEREKVVLTDSENSLSWRLEFIVDQKAFMEEILENQTYVVIGTIAALIIIIQASIFISYNVALPIRNMSRTCQEINENRGSYRSYRFDTVSRRDEIGQLAKTFELLLKNMDNYTKMEYTSRMSATLAHEIKNPLAGIRSGIQVLKGRTVKEGDQMLCSTMIREIDRVAALITNLCTLSVKRDSSREQVILKPVLKELELFYAKGLKQQGITFSVSVKGEPSAFLNQDELKQILHNLIGNSVKAIGKRGDGAIHLEAFMEEMGQERFVKIVLTDNGCGMTEEELEKALEPFYTKSINGIGLGLAIVRKLTEQNGGSLQMESIPGVGTRTQLDFKEPKEGKHEPNSHSG